MDNTEQFYRLLERFRDRAREIRIKPLYIKNRKLYRLLKLSIPIAYISDPPQGDELLKEIDRVLSLQEAGILKDQDVKALQDKLDSTMNLYANEKP